VPEITVNPEAGPDVLPSGDTWFTDISTLPANLNTYATTLVWGNTDAKSEVNEIIALRYDLSAIPIGSTILRAKLTVKASATNATAVGMLVSVLKPDGKWDAASRSQVAQPGVGLRTRFRDTAAANLGDAATTNDFDLRFESDRGQYGFGQVQTLTATGNGLLGSVLIRLARVGSSAGNVWAEVWDTIGSNGAYLPNTLRATSDLRTFNSLSTLETSSVFTFSGAQQIAVASGQRYIVILKTDAVLTTSSPSIRVYQLSTFDGSVDNAVYFGPSAGWSNCLYADPGDVRLLPVFTTGASILPPVIAMTINVVYTLGDAAYSPSQSFAFASVLQQAVSDASWNGRLAFRIGRLLDINGTERYLWSQNQPGETGPQLTVEYAPPGIDLSHGEPGSVASLSVEDPGTAPAVAATVGAVASISANDPGTVPALDATAGAVAALAIQGRGTE